MQALKLWSSNGEIQETGEARDEEPTLRRVYLADNLDGSKRRSSMDEDMAMELGRQQKMPKKKPEHATSRSPKASGVSQKDGV